MYRYPNSNITVRITGLTIHVSIIYIYNSRCQSRPFIYLDTRKEHVSLQDGRRNIRSVSFLEEWLRREDETRAQAATDEERDVGRHALRDVDDMQMADSPGPSGIARKTTYSPTHDEPQLRSLNWFRIRRTKEARLRK